MSKLFLFFREFIKQPQNALELLREVRQYQPTELYYKDSTSTLGIYK